MHLVQQDIPAGAEAGAIRKARRLALNRSVLKLSLLNVAVYSAIYGASTRGEPGSVVEFILVPLAVVSTISLANSIIRRLALVFESRSPKNGGRARND
ncbi:hypothetical protein [Duganella hordei]|uniref:hypothetical protein n=1 Tax=Duganella hordei TaxID=2865934 RepID=UPI0030E9B123